MSDDARDRDGIAAEMQQDAELAVSTAEGFGAALDFSAESIGTLEDLVTAHGVARRACIR